MTQEVLAYKMSIKILDVHLKTLKIGSPLPQKIFVLIYFKIVFRTLISRINLHIQRSLY